jgi:predicted RNA-binding Zn-ribbon protein involved in translation (DUF1610 family)
MAIAICAGASTGMMQDIGSRQHLFGMGLISARPTTQARNPTTNLTRLFAPNAANITNAPTTATANAPNAVRSSANKPTSPARRAYQGENDMKCTECGSAIPYDHRGESDICPECATVVIPADHDLPSANLTYLYTRIGGMVRRQCAVPSYLDPARVIVCDLSEAPADVVSDLQRAGLKPVEPGERCELRFTTDGGQHETE